MPRFMLDTDTCSYIMKRSHPLVVKRLQAVAVGDVCMSVVTKAELLYGVEVSPRRAHDGASIGLQASPKARIRESAVLCASCGPRWRRP